MLTPLFELSQCDETVSVKVHIPNANISQTEVTVTENIFLFNGPPYFLRLTLPHHLQDSELEGTVTVKYESDSCDMIFTCKKEVKGQFFPDLDMLTKLQADKTKKKAKPNIETISSSDNANISSDELVEDSLAKLNYAEKSIVDGYKYGFANARANVPGIQDLLYGFLDIKDPYNTSPEERKSQRERKETKDFCPYHYIGDFKEKDAFKDFINFSLKLLSVNSEGESSAQFTNEEKFALNNLRNKEVLVSSDEKNQVMCGLVSILLSWCYNHRASEAEAWSESAWTIIKLTPMFCWFDAPDSLHESVHSFFRRSLSYPITRNYECSQTVVQDVLKILKIGKHQMLKCLLDVRTIFEENELTILNELYISDYCVWVQSLEDEDVKDLYQQVDAIVISKSELNLDLPLYERLSQDDSDEEEDLEDKMNGLCLGNPMIETEVAGEASNNNKFVIAPGVLTAGASTGVEHLPALIATKSVKKNKEIESDDSSSNSDGDDTDSDDSSSDDSTSDDSDSDESDSDDSSSDDSDDSSDDDNSPNDASKIKVEDLDSDDSIEEAES